MEIKPGTYPSLVSFGRGAQSRETVEPEKGSTTQRTPFSSDFTEEEMRFRVDRALMGTPVENVTILDKGLLKSRKATPEEIAAFTATQAAYEKSMADQEAWEKEITNQESHEAYLSNVADMDLDAARREVNVVKVYMDSGILDGLHINAFNGDQKTSSLQEYLSWVYQRIEALETSAPAA